MKHEIVMAVGGALIAVGLVTALVGAMPATENKTVEVPMTYQFAGVYYGGLLFGSVQVEYEVDSGRAMQVYVFSEEQYDSYYDDIWTGCIYQEIGGSGEFSFKMGDTGDHYIIFEHEDLVYPLDERVAVSLTVNGISVLAVGISASLIALGVVVLILGGRRKARASSQVERHPLQGFTVDGRPPPQPPPGQ